VVDTHHLAALLTSAPAARLAGVKSLVHTEHAYQYLGPSRGYRATLRTLSRLLRTLVVVGDELVTYYEKSVGVARGRLRVIPNGIDLSRYRPPADRSEEHTSELQSPYDL